MSSARTISVVITAHNAADSIGECLRSVAAQTELDDAQLEIVLIDDRSTDSTGQAARDLNLINLRVVRIDEYSNRSLTARQIALDRGFGEATGEVIFVTDADAVVSERWVAAMLARMETRGADAVAGPVGFSGPSGWIGGLQSVDALFYSGVCRILNALKLESGAFFGNFAFRREIYEAVGGFEAIGFGLTEDLMFCRALHRKGYRLAFHARPLVTVRACESLGQVIRRSQRVSQGGFSALSFVIGVWMLALIVLSFAAVFVGGAFAWLFALRYAAGVSFAGLTVVRAGQPRLLSYTLIYEPLAVMMGVCTLVRGSFRRDVEWGGVRYERGSTGGGSSEPKP